MSFSANQATMTAVIGKVYGDPGFYLNKELAKNEAWGGGKLADDGESLELNLDEKTGKVKEKNDTYVAAKELGKKDLIVGYTHRYRNFYDEDINTNFPIKYWVVSKSWLRSANRKSEKIKGFLKVVNDNDSEFGKSFGAAWENGSIGNFNKLSVRLLQQPPGEFDGSYFLPAAARQFVMNVLVNSKTKTEHTFRIFKARCEHYLKSTSWRRNGLSYPNGQLKTALVNRNPEKQYDSESRVTDDSSRYTPPIDTNDNFF